MDDDEGEGGADGRNEGEASQSVRNGVLKAKNFKF